MDIDRIVNAQEALKELFPDLNSAITVTIAQLSVGAIDQNHKNGVDPYWDVAALIENLTPGQYADVMVYQAGALFIMEADRLWLSAIGEMPTTGDGA